VKDASPGASALQALASDAHAFLGVSRRRSPPRRPKSIVCRRCDCPPRRRPLRATGPTKAHVPTTPREGRRLSADRMLSTVTIRRGTRGSLLQPCPASASRSRRPHVFPWLGKGVLSGLASAPERVTPSGSFRESQRLFHLQVGDSVPGPDDPSTPAGSVGVVVARAVCLARAYAGRSASTASTTESSWRAGGHRQDRSGRNHNGQDSHPP
jgi:hypothetical protein